MVGAYFGPPPPSLKRQNFAAIYRRNQTPFQSADNSPVTCGAQTLKNTVNHEQVV